MHLPDNSLTPSDYPSSRTYDFNPFNISEPRSYPQTPSPVSIPCITPTCTATIIDLGPLISSKPYSGFANPTATCWSIPIPHAHLSVQVRRGSSGNVLRTVSDLRLDELHLEILDLETLYQLMRLRTRLGNVIAYKKCVMRELQSRNQQHF